MKTDLYKHFYDFWLIFKIAEREDYLEIVESSQTDFKNEITKCIKCAKPLLN